MLMKQTMAHQVDMKNFVKYWKYFLWYSNTRVHSRKYCLGFLYETLFVFVIIPIVYEDPLEWFFFLPDHCDPLLRFGILLFSRDTNGDARNFIFTYIQCWTLGAIFTGPFLLQLKLGYNIYRVSHSDMAPFKWPRGAEILRILMIHLWLHGHEGYPFVFHQPVFKKVASADLNSLQQKGYQTLVKNWIFDDLFNKKGPL